jgi:hypothetical protein
VSHGIRYRQAETPKWAPGQQRIGRNRRAGFGFKLGAVPASKTLLTIYLNAQLASQVYCPRTLATAWRGDMTKTSE